MAEQAVSKVCVWSPCEAPATATAVLLTAGPRQRDKARTVLHDVRACPAHQALLTLDRIMSDASWADLARSIEQGGGWRPLVVGQFDFDGHA